MFLTGILKSLKSREHRLAWLVAMAADAIQIGLLPLFAEGGFSPADPILDLIVAAVLTRLIGWHWAFVPTILAELVPGLDLFPTWTTAVLFVTRQRGHRQVGDVEVLPKDAPVPPVRPTSAHL
jgi:hypothetical protein